MAEPPTSAQSGPTNFLARIRAEAAAQPGKAALLIGLIIIGSAVWGSRLVQGMVSTGAVAADSVPQAPLASPRGGTGQMASGALEAGIKPVPKEMIASTGTDPCAAEWIETLEDVLSRSAASDGWKLGSYENPFVATCQQPLSQAEGTLPTVDIETMPRASEVVGKESAFPLNALILKAVLIMGEQRGAILGEKLYVLRPGGPRPIIPVEAEGGKFSVELLAIEPDGVLIGYGGKTARLTFSAPESLCRLTPNDAGVAGKTQDGTF